MSRRKKSRKTATKKSSNYLLIVVVILGLILLFLLAKYIYTEWKHKEALRSIRTEYAQILLNEQRYLKEEGNVLSGSTPELDIVHENKVKLPIVMYHYVEVVKDEGDRIRKSLNIHPYVFERQMKALSDAKFETYFVKDVPTILRGVNHISTRSAVLTFDDGYEDFYTYAFPILKKYNIKSTIYLVWNFIGRKGFLNKKQINEIIDSGIVEVGSHAVNHIGLSGLPVKSEKFQIDDSKDLLEEEFGIEISTFAYPYGSYDERSTKLVEDAQYIAAVSVKSGAFHSPDEMFALKRLRAGMFGDRIVEVMDGLSR